MNLTRERLTRRFTGPFSPQQATVLAEAISDSYEELVKTSDFNELKEIVRGLAQAQARTEVRMEELAQAQTRTEVRMEELAQAQTRTEVRMEELAQAQARTEVRMEELAQAQTRTEVRMEELAQAQTRTEVRMEELAQAQTRTEKTVRNLAQEVGGLSRSVSYSLENEAYRLLPAYLAREHGIRLDERLIRTEIGGEEVNLFALGQRDGRPIVLVGETKLQFDRKRGNRDALARALEQLERKVEAVQAEYPDREVVRLLITHYARPAIQKAAAAQNVIIVQSFDW